MPKYRQLFLSQREIFHASQSDTPHYAIEAANRWYCPVEIEYLEIRDIFFFYIFVYVYRWRLPVIFAAFMRRRLLFSLPFKVGTRQGKFFTAAATPPPYRMAWSLSLSFLIITYLDADKIFSWDAFAWEFFWDIDITPLDIIKRAIIYENIYIYAAAMPPIIFASMRNVFHFQSLPRNNTMIIRNADTLLPAFSFLRPRFTDIYFHAVKSFSSFHYLKYAIRDFLTLKDSYIITSIFSTRRILILWILWASNTSR